MKIYNGYNRLNENYTLLTDDYEYKMANGYIDSRKENESVAFDIFFRKGPNNVGYSILAGLDKIIAYMENEN